MKGRQLVSIKITKKKALSMCEDPIGYIRGVSEDIQIISPKERKLKNQIYLKSISPIIPKINKPLGSNSISIVDSIHHNSDLKQVTCTSNFTFASKNNAKIFRLDPNSAFSVHFREKEEKELVKLNTELFPKEFNEEIQYVPDYTPSRIINHIDLEKSNKNSSGNFQNEPNTIGNLVRSRQEVRKIDVIKLRKSQFTSYSTGWGSFYNRSPINSPRRYRVNLKSLVSDL